MACPNCGGELVSSLEIKDEKTGKVLQEVTPEGGVLVCSNCNQAATAEEGQQESVEPSDESNVLAIGPRAEDLPREEGEPVPEAPPTDVLAEAEEAPAEEPAEPGEDTEPDTEAPAEPEEE